VCCGGRRERARRQFRVIVVGVERRGVARRGQYPLDAAAHAIARRGELLGAPEGTLHEDGHEVVARKHHRHRIAVPGRNIGEILDIAAHVIVVVLHHQNIDPLPLHGGANGLPSAFQLGGGDGRVQPFTELRHVLDRSLLEC